MTTLFTYVVAHDSGFAPNPYGGICTLTTCKTPIRKVAKEGDYIVGTAGIDLGIDNPKNKVIYVMKITEVKTMEEYFKFCKEELQIKIPKKISKKIEEKLGDCIYEYRGSKIIQNKSGQHKTQKDQIDDLAGKFSLISNDFIFFGKNAIDLPKDLQKIVKTCQGHRGPANEKFIPQFEKWFKEIKKKYKGIVGEPCLKEKIESLINKSSCIKRVKNQPVDSSFKKAC